VVKGKRNKNKINQKRKNIYLDKKRKIKEKVLFD